MSLKVIAIHTPLENPLTPSEIRFQENIFDKEQFSLNNIGSYNLIRSCEEANLLFPQHYSKLNNFFEGILIKKS